MVPTGDDWNRTCFSLFYAGSRRQLMQISFVLGDYCAAFCLFCCNKQFNVCMGG